MYFVKLSPTTNSSFRDLVPKQQIGRSLCLPTNERFLKVVEPVIGLGIVFLTQYNMAEVHPHYTPTMGSITKHYTHTCAKLDENHPPSPINPPNG